MASIRVRRGRRSAGCLSGLLNLLRGWLNEQALISWSLPDRRMGKSSGRYGSVRHRTPRAGKPSAPSACSNHCSVLAVCIQRRGPMHIAAAVGTPTIGLFGRARTRSGSRTRNREVIWHCGRKCPAIPAIWMCATVRKRLYGVYEASDSRRCCQRGRSGLAVRRKLH